MMFAGHPWITYRPTIFGLGSGPIYLGYLQCTGSEQRIVDCELSQNFESDCSHFSAVGLECSCEKK